MSNLLDFARAEMRAAGLYDEDADYDGAIPEAVEGLLREFANQGHSGASAALTLAIFTRLARFEPLGPLTGADEEWIMVMDGVWQNRRCSRVFKDATGRAYDMDGRVFVEPDGVTYTNRDSRVYVTFPYTPTTEYVQVTPTPGGSDAA